jgi:hypothetical protein
MAGDNAAEDALCPRILVERLELNPLGKQT